jgi:hypothetical protein
MGSKLKPDGPHHEEVVQRHRHRHRTQREAENSDLGSNDWTRVGELAERPEDTTKNKSRDWEGRMDRATPPKDSHGARTGSGFYHHWKISMWVTSPSIHENEIWNQVPARRKRALLTRSWFTLRRTEREQSGFNEEHERKAGGEKKKLRWRLQIRW